MKEKDFLNFSRTFVCPDASSRRTTRAPKRKSSIWSTFYEPPFRPKKLSDKIYKDFGQNLILQN
jgi:hypothetical protein